MRNVGIIMRRELASYFATPLAYVFILIFLVLANAFTFYLGGFYERRQADLDPFFTFHPWLYLFLIPAISMKLWAEERKSGSIELLMTQPVELWDAVLGKFLAIGSCMSALTRNQVVAFILGVAGCFVFLLAGFPLVLDVFRSWAPQALVDAIASLSFLTHFESIVKGVIDVRDLLYFAMLIGFFLLATTIALNLRKDP